MTPPYEIAPERKSVINEFLADKTVREKAEAVKANQSALPAFKEFIAPRLENIVKTKEELQYLQQQIETDRTVPEVFNTPLVREAIIEAAKNKLATLRQDLEKNGSKEPWLDEGQQRIAWGVGIGAGAALLLTGAVLLWRRTKKKAGELKDAAKEKMGRLTKTLLIGGAVALAGVAGYFGAVKFKDYLTSYGEKLKEDLKNTVKEKAEAVVDGAQKIGDTVTDGIRNKSVESEPEENKNEQSDKEKKVSEAVKENAQDALINHITDGSTGATVFETMRKNQWTMGRILEMYDIEKGQLKASVKEGWRELIPSVVQDPLERAQYEESAATITKLLAEYGLHMQKGYESEREKNPSMRPFEELPIDEVKKYVIDQSQQFNAIADGFLSIESIRGFDIQEKVFDPMIQSGALGNILLVSSRVPGLSHSSSLSELSLQDVMTVATSDNVLGKTGTYALEKYPAQDEKIVSGIKTNIQKLRDEIEKVDAETEIDKHRGLSEQLKIAEQQLREMLSRQALREIVEFISGSGESLLPLFHGVLPDREWSEKKEENIAAINGYLRNMTIGQIIRFYAYRKMMVDGHSLEQASALMGQQMEIFHIMNEKDAGWKFGFLHFERRHTKSKEATLALFNAVLDDDEWEENVGEALGISTDAISHAYAALSQPGAEIAGKALEYLVGPVNYAYDFYLAKLRQNTAVTVGLTAGAGLFVSSQAYCRAGRLVNYWKNRRQLHALESKMLTTNPPIIDVTQRVIERFIPEAHYLNQRLGGEIVKAIRDAAGKIDGDLGRLVQADLSKWATGGNSIDEMQEAITSSVRSRLPAMEADLAKAQAFIGPSTVAELDRVKVLESNVNAAKEYLETVRVKFLNPENADALKALAWRARPILESPVLKKISSSFRAAGSGGSVLWGAGVGVGGYMTYLDAQENLQMRSDRRETIRTGRKMLSSMADELRANPTYKEKEGAKDVFVHVQSGAEVNLRVAREKLDMVADAFDDRITNQNWRVGTDMAGTASLLFMGPRLATGPVGLALAVGEGIVHLGIAANDQKKMRQFIVDSPPWILASMGTSKTTGTSEYNWLRGSSSWMLSDFVGGVTETASLATPVGGVVLAKNSLSANNDKPVIAKKVLFAIMMGDLRSDAPEIQQAMLGGMETPQEADSFYEGEFNTHLLPLLSICLHSQAGISWQDAQALDIESGMMVMPPKVSLLDIRKAFRSAALLYIEHKKEKDIRNLGAKMLEWEKEGKTEELEYAIGMLEEMRAQTIMGVRLDGLPDGEKTIVETLIEQVRQKNNAGEKTISLEFTHPDGSTAITNISSLGAVAAFIADPVLRERYKQVLADSTMEIDSRVDELNLIEDMLKHGLWVAFEPNTAMSKQSYEGALEATNIVYKAMHNEEIGSGIAHDRLRQVLTETVVSLVASKRSGKSFRTISSGEYQDENSPLIMERVGKSPRANIASADADYTHIGELFSLLTNGPALDQDVMKKYPLIAVICEGDAIAGTENSVVALATYIYGDISTLGTANPTIFVAQRGATGMHKIGFGTSKHTSVLQGDNHVMKYEDFMRQPHAKEMLQNLQTGFVERASDQKKEHEDAVKRSNEAQERFKREKQPAIDARTAKEKEAQLAAIERSKTSSVLVYIPPVLGEQPRCRMTKNGVSVSFEIPRLAGASFNSNDWMDEVDAQGISVTVENKGSTKTVYVANDSEEWKSCTQEEKGVIQEALGQSLHNLDSSLDSDLVKSYEIERIVYMSGYKRARTWDAKRVRDEFVKQVSTLYKVSIQKNAFLNTLVREVQATPVIDYARTQAIVKLLKQAN